MIKEIKYSGLSVVPSDYDCEDGQLAASVNLVSENGALRPLSQPKTLLSLGLGKSVLYIHKTSSYEHYLVLSTAVSSSQPRHLDYYDTAGNFITSILTLTNGNESIRQITSMGNTLIILTTVDTYYYLWKDGAYTLLGTQIPEIELSFGLTGTMHTDAETIYYDKFSDGAGTITEFSDANKIKVTDGAFGIINKLISEKCEKAGRFCFPFLVRYALRMYDQTIIHHSAPVLMLTSGQYNPYAWTESDPSGGSTSLNCGLVAHDLNYAVISDTIDKLKQWSDIITSVDIFVSAPIYTFKQDGQCSKFLNMTANTTTYKDYALGHFSGPRSSHTTISDDGIYDIYRKQYRDASKAVYELALPYKDMATIKESIESCSTFYLFKSIELGSLSTSRTTISVPEDYLKTIVNREAMTDDYDSHDHITAKHAFIYNSRLNLAGIEKTLFKGYSPRALFCYHHTGATTTDTAKAYVFIKTDSGESVVVSDNNAAYNIFAMQTYFFYPNSKAYKAILDFGTQQLTFNLKAHDTLNGAYYFSGIDFVDYPKASADNLVTPTLANNALPYPSKLYTSEVNNPWLFLATGINTIGSGTILALSSAAKALSQGQFGEFPLYAFTSDGVWALTVNSTGGFSAKQPITRDVCLSADSVTQIDSSVLFATSRGIMEISGSETTCISEELVSDDSFDVSSLPNIDKLIALSPNLNAATIAPMRFLDYVKNCRMLFDYTNRRIIVFNPECPYAYMLSLRSAKWGMIQCSLDSTVNAYPDAIAMDAAGNLVTFSCEAAADAVPTFLVTRPLKLDAPDILKTLDTIMQRGNFPRTDVKVALSGSRDLINWFYIASSTNASLRGFIGTPYKYFRIVLFGDITPKHSLSSCSVSHTLRLTNKLR